MRQDIPDAVDGYAKSVYDYSLPSGDFDIRVDIAGYFADVPDTAGPTIYFEVRSSNETSNYFNLFYGDWSTNNCQVVYVINGAAPVTSSATHLADVPTQLRLTRVGNIISGYAYDGSWHTIAQINFSSYSSTLEKIWLRIYDRSLHGGYVDWDNLIFIQGCPT
jgi:hypothetical protein